MFPIHAECQCGQVQYNLKREPNVVFACHCKECQKLATTPFSVTAIVDADSIELTGDMGEWRRIADSGNVNAAKFCTTCGNRIYHYNPADKTTLKVKLKPVETSVAHYFEPSVHVWVSEKVDWVEIPDHVKTFEKGPE